MYIKKGTKKLICDNGPNTKKLIYDNGSIQLSKMLRGKCSNVKKSKGKEKEIYFPRVFSWQRIMQEN